MDIQNEFYDRLTSEQVIAFKNELQRLLEIMDHTIPLQDRREELQRFVVKYFLAGIHFNTIETVRLIVKKTNMSAEQISEVTLLPLEEIRDCINKYPVPVSRFTRRRALHTRNV